jgi:hypothetical protein
MAEKKQTPYLYQSCMILLTIRSILKSMFEGGATMEVAKQATLIRHGHLNTKYNNFLIHELPRHERNEIIYGNRL